MAMLLMYLKVFAVGGLICMLAQVLINLTKMTSARILVTFLLLGCLMEAVGIYEPIQQWAGAGVSVPITGFGATLVRGAVQGIGDQGPLGVVVGGLTAASGGLAAAIVFGFVMAILFKSRTKT